MSTEQFRKPWIGRDFGETGFGAMRLLILGESHYWSPERADDPTLTCETVTSVVNGLPHRFFTAIESAVMGCNSAHTDPATFWNAVAFANFCQGAAESREAGTTVEMWRAGVRTFPAMLSHVRPNRLLMFSIKAWNHTNKFEDLTWEGQPPVRHHLARRRTPFETGYFSATDGSLRVLSMAIWHPSARGFGEAQKWHPTVKEFLERPLG